MRKMSIIEFLKERPLTVAAKEWLDNLIQSFREVDATDNTGLEIDSQVNQTVAELETAQASSDSIPFGHGKGGKTKARVNNVQKTVTRKPSPKKNIEKSKDFDIDK